MSQVPRIFIDEEPPITGAQIRVIGVGGGGINAVNRMIDAGINGIELIVADTDLQSLKRSRASLKIQLGSRLTKGLGSGADPEVGRQAALQDTDKIIEVLEGSDLVFVTAGLGGGTGTGAAPIVAALATELGALTVAVVTKPFRFEGIRRLQQAEQGLSELLESVDSVISIPNERVYGPMTQTEPVTEALRLVDDVLRETVKGITDLITVPGFINLDFADLRVIFKGMGMARMGKGYGNGENRAIEAGQQAISSPLLEFASIRGARGVLINITGGHDLTLYEINEAASIVREAAGEDANIIFGHVIDDTMTDAMEITIIATGCESDETQPLTPMPEEYHSTRSSIASKMASLRPKQLAERPPDILIAWDPEFVTRDDYAALVTALGDLVRNEGGLGIERIKHVEVYIPMHEGLLV